MVKRTLCVMLLSGCGVGELVIEDGEPPPEPGAAQLSGDDPANGAVYGLDVSMWEGPLAQYEVDCFYRAGVRHLVAGTQVEEVTRQQLAMARERGMSIDAYVYLYWNRDLKQQVDQAFARVQGFDIGRMWLDVEEKGEAQALGANAMLERVQAAVDACRAHPEAACGIYTGMGFWNGYLNGSTRFADVPLWYARYNDVTSLSAWPQERFGGWSSPAAKQWAERALCNVGVDHDTMQVLKPPAVIVDRTLPPGPTAPPPAPQRLYPADLSRTALADVKLMVATIPHATRYDLALESWSGTGWVPYATWRTAAPFKKVSPAFRDRYFRFRARAMNAFGWGAWSAFNTFAFGQPGGTPPPEAPQMPPPVTPPPDLPPPVTPPPAGALTPDGATLPAGSAVTLRGPATAGATLYELAVELETSTGGWVTYYTYSSTAPQKAFWPQGVNGFRWRLRAKVSGAWGAWSSWASFKTT